jgi:hypothetical protein
MDRKSNPYTKPPSRPIRDKLIGFRVASYLDQPHCLAVVTKGWQVPQMLAAHRIHTEMRRAGDNTAQ